MDSVYNVPRTLYSHALLYEAGAKEKKELAKKAISAFMDFELDYGNMMKAFESSIFWALTHKELGEFSECYPRFDFTISLKTFFDGQLPDDAREIVLTGFYYKALTYNEERKFREAIQTISEMLSDPMLKNSAQMRIGISATLVQGDAYVGLGEKDKAIALGQKLLKEVTNEGMISLIKRRVTEWASGGGGDVGIHLMAYDTAMESDRYPAAIAALQKAVAAAEQSDQNKEIPELLWKMANVYGNYMERLYDAVIVYETIASDHPASDKAARSAFEAARLWSRIATLLGADKGFEKDQVTKNLELLTKKWPADPNAKNAQFLVAEAYYDKGQYEEAAKAYGLVPQEATYYEQAMVMSGKAYYDLGKKLWADGKQDDKTRNLFAQSEAAFAKFLKFMKENPPKSEADQKNRPAVEAFCKQALANLLMHDARKKYDEALKVLDEIEAAGPPDEVRKRVLSQKVKAYLTLKMTDKAIATVELMLTSYANATVTVDACQLVGQRCDEEAEALVGADPTPDKITDEALKYWELAAKYYANWIHSAVQAKQRIAPADAQAVADRIYNLGVIINALDDKKSFTSYDLNTLKNVRIFRDAAKIYEPISNEELGSLKGIDSGKLMLKRAWCNCWAQEWEQARDAYELLIDSERLRNAGGKTLNDAVLKSKAWLFVAYEELGHVYIKLGEAGINKSQSLQEAYVIFANVVDKSTKDTEGWWRAKYLVIKILFDRGGQGDFEMAQMGIENMRQNYPKWEENKFGLSAMYDSLEASIKSKAPRK
jgi:tetratricopeptide (TPR) repeat protein